MIDGYQVETTMIEIREWKDFRQFGIETLTGEACGLSMRILCDVTEAGRKLFCQTFGLPVKTNSLGEPWNRGTPNDPHVASVMLTRDALPPLSVFALLSKARECYFVVDAHGAWCRTLAAEPGDDPQQIQDWIEFQKSRGYHVRRFGCDGTAGDRNVHQMSGRVE